MEIKLTHYLLLTFLGNAFVTRLDRDHMARNYKEHQAKMDPASVADNRRRVREELQRMALEEPPDRSRPPG